MRNLTLGIGHNSGNSIGSGSWQMIQEPSENLPNPPNPPRPNDNEQSSPPNPPSPEGRPKPSQKRPREPSPQEVLVDDLVEYLGCIESRSETLCAWLEKSRVELLDQLSTILESAIVKIMTSGGLALALCIRLNIEHKHIPAITLFIKKFYS